MKRRIILLCMLIAACPIKGADSSASGSQVRLGVTIEYEPLEVDSSDDKGKEEEQTVCKVHLKRDGQEIVPPFAIALLDQCFAADLMKAAGGFVQDDKEAWIRNIFQDYTDDQIRLFVGALEHNSEDDAAIWVNGLSNDDCISLIAIANCWDIKFIMQACPERLARDITDTDADTLSGDVQYLLKDQLKHNLTDLNWHILKRLSFPSRDLFCMSDLEDRQQFEIDLLNRRVEESLHGRHICNGKRLIVWTGNRVIVYDFMAQSYKSIFIADDREWIDEVYSCEDENKLLIRTDKHLILYDFATNEHKKIFASPYTFQLYCFFSDGVGLLAVTNRGIWTNYGLPNAQILCYDSKKELMRELCTLPFMVERVFNDNDRCFILTRERIVVCNVVTGAHNDIFVTSGREWFSYIYNFDKEIYITTNKRIILYDIAKGLHRELFVAADNEGISVLERGITKDGNHIIVTVGSNNGMDRRIIIYDVNTCSYKEIFEGKNMMRCSAYYNAEESGIIIETSDSVLFYDLEKETINTLFSSRGASPTVQHDSHEGVLIAAGHRICMHRLQENQVRDIFCTDNNEHIYSAKYIHDGQAMLIHTKERIIIIPIPISPEQYEQLSLQQLQLLYKALISWKLGKPYDLALDELDLYKSLPKEFQVWQLFSTYCADIDDNPMNPSMFMGDAIYGPSEGCQVM